MGSWYNWHDHLKFQIIPAWDESKISTSEFIDTFDDDPSKYSLPPENENIEYINVLPCLLIPCEDDSMDDLFMDSFIEPPTTFIPDIEITDNSMFMLAENFNTYLFMSEENFYTCLDIEKTTGTIKLRRLLPNTLKNNKLLICLAPDKINEILIPGLPNADGTSIWDLTIRRETLKSILEEAEGKSFVDAVVEKLASIGIEPPKLSKIARSVDVQLFYEASSSRDQLWDIVSEKGFGENLDEFFKEVFRSIFYPVCTEFALENKRNELLNWTNEVEKGKAIFVDAPMGLGKTYAIAEALASDPNLSAVIFMPTNKLCQEIIENLKSKITSKSKNNTMNLYDDKDQVKDDNGKPIFDDDGSFLYRYKSTYLNEEVYYADGINENECPKVEEIIGRYQKNWINKKLVCKKCEKEKTCRFLHHVENAANARIIVTTHHQYDHFYHDDMLHCWNVEGSTRPRDLFIIDEDLVFSQLYQPINLEYPELRAFVQTITHYLQKNADISHMRESIDLLFSQISKCDKTSIIRSIDPDFEFPYKFVAEWENSLPKQPFIIPEYIQWSGIVGNHLKVIEHAVRFGAVVEKWGKRFKVRLPNPRAYDLSNVPPHVFFDGTMLSERFLGNKLSGVEFKKLRIDINYPWEIKVFQNTNSDLPEKWIERDKPKVQIFLKSIIDKLPYSRKIFLITTNAITKAYLKNFIEDECLNRQIVSGYYGNIRGINDAQECDVGIMLGSFMPSDSVEIAMALEFINPEDLETDITLTENNLWTWGDTNGVRTYRNKFSVVGEMAKARRYSEHRQALARTRYLFHDVDFYIISKDLVSDYDPFLPEPIDCQYRNDLFKGRPQRPEAKEKYDEVKEMVLEWLKTHDTVYATEIYDRYGLWRKTVGKKLKEMCEKGLLELVKGKKKTYRLPATEENGQDIL